MAQQVLSPLRPVRLLLTTLETHGAQTREGLWKLVSSVPDNTIKSKSQMKRVMRELVRRGVVNASTDVRRIRELNPKKQLSSKHEPSYLFKLKGRSRYGDSANDQTNVKDKQ